MSQAVRRACLRTALACILLAAWAVQASGAPTWVTTADGVRLPANWPEVVADEYPFGHAKFQPTPARPLGYRGCQNGWFPGATPPLSFGEGTPAEVMMPIRDQWGAVRSQKVWTITDDKARNIRFKTPMPGWSLSQPLPVLCTDGRLRIIAKCHPWWVICVDGETGEVLWKDELTPLHAQGLPRDKADRQAEVLTMVWACTTTVPALLGGNVSGITGKARAKPRAENPALYAGIERALATMEARMQVLDADLAPLVGKLLTVVQSDDLASWNAPASELARAFRAHYKVGTDVWFHGYTGLEMPAPVSDGTSVYVTFGQGQVGCYDLITGALKWSRIVQTPSKSPRSMYYATPALIENRLIFYLAPEQKGGLTALDTATGEIVWQNNAGTMWAKGSYTSIRPVRIQGANGVTLEAVIARGSGPYVAYRVSDGAVIGSFACTGGYDAGPYVVNDTLITSTGGADGGPKVGWARLLQVDAAGQLTGVPLFEFGKENMPSSHPFAASPTALLEARGAKGAGGPIVDPTTGVRLANLPVGGDTVTIAGSYAIYPSFSPGTGFNDRGREDGWAVAAFAIVDISDPVKPRLVSKDNVLVSRHLPADLVFDRHLAPFGLSKESLLGQDRTILPHFGCANSGVIPHGDMLFIQSATDLYGIGQGK